MKRPPWVFVGSSVEGLDIAYAVQENLEHFSEPTVWDQGIFELTQSSLTELTRAVSSFDFGVFVLSPDDVALIRGDVRSVARDNVIFELGMFVGGLGVDRTFFLVPRGCAELHLPTDLAGITAGTYDASRTDKNVRAALGPACNKIRRQVEALGAINLRQQSPSPMPDAEEDAPDVVSSDQRRKIRDELLRSVKKANSIFSEATSRSSFEYGEQNLSRWKRKMATFINANVSESEALSFLKIHTSIKGGQDMEHLESSYLGHINFLESLAGELESDDQFASSGKGAADGADLPDFGTFSYTV